MKRDELRHMPRKTTDKIGEQVGREINERMETGRFRGWLMRRHWVWLWVIIAGSWGLDFVINHALMAANLAAGLGHWIDCILGPIDAALVAAAPLASVRELWRRVWVLYDRWRLSPTSVPVPKAEVPEGASVHEEATDESVA